MMKKLPVILFAALLLLAPLGAEAGGREHCKPKPPPTTPPPDTKPPPEPAPGPVALKSKDTNDGLLIAAGAIIAGLVISSMQDDAESTAFTARLQPIADPDDRPRLGVVFSYRF